MSNIRKLSSGLAEIAKKDLLEIESEIPEKLNTIRKWIQEQPTLKTPLDDQFLLTFLRGNKYDLLNTQDMIKNFFTTRQTISKVFTNRDPYDGKNDQLMRVGVTSILPNTIGENGPRVILIRPGSYDTNKFTYYEIMKMSTAATDIMLMNDDNCIIAGTVRIMDMDNLSKGHFIQFDMDLMKKMTVLGQKYQPYRQIALHYINTPWAFRSVFNVLKSFMSEESKKHVFVHSTIESLFDHVPKEYLPKEYGGSAGTLEEIGNYWAKKMIDHREFLLQWDEYARNEELAAEIAKNSKSKFWW